MDVFSQESRELFTKFLSKITFGLENYEIKGYKMGWSITLLNYIEIHPGCNMREISKFLSVPPSSATRKIDKLVNNQLISRKMDPDDRRSITLNLTDKGYEIYNDFLNSRMKGLVKMKEHISPEEFKIFFKVIREFIEIDPFF